LSCQRNIYIIDNFFKRKDGEILDIKDVEKEERNVYSLMLMYPESEQQQQVANKEEEKKKNLNDNHTCRKW
jgi:hypothetical protein